MGFVFLHIKYNSIKMNILIIGHGRHGKDTLAELLKIHAGLSFKSSSEAAAEIFIYDALKKKYGYKTFTQCYDDRHNHRAEWYDLITAYNKDDRAKLAKDILALNDCYVGMRDREEILECKRQKIFDLIIWVDASDRLPLEDKSSFNIDKNLADIIIDNNSTYDEFESKVIRLSAILDAKNNTYYRA